MHLSKLSSGIIGTIMLCSSYETNFIF